MEKNNMQTHPVQGEHKEHASHHDHMVADYKRRFKVCLALTIPVLALSPMIQSFLGIEGRIVFPGDSLLLFVLASVVYFFGGWPFLKGLFTEAAARRPGMMTLIAVAISSAYGYSAAVVFDKTGTLTEGLFGVQGIIPSENMTEDQILRLAASVESLSEHPIAKGVVAEASTRGIKVPPNGGFRAGGGCPSGRHCPG
ncbi:copper-exporting P-type ATPase B [bacterium BMS3Abin14]|nr:copper-exporting P-type ATPase B [bacterium BMS3Abin14]